MASPKERLRFLKISVCLAIVLSFTRTQTAVQGNGNSRGQSGQFLAGMTFNDPAFSQQSYLNEMYPKTAVVPNTMNIQKAWQNGYTGKNVTICISDPTGVDYNNAELNKRFVKEASYNFDQNISDVSPYLGRSRNKHGTSMAGLAAGEANNGVCIVGVAFEAYISSVKTLLSDRWSAGRDETQIVADSFSFENQRNDIYSCSWGNMTMFQTNVAYVPQKIKNAIKRAAEKGRNGKGNIILFSAGNGGTWNGTCSYDEYLSLIYTIGISVVTKYNNASRQNVPCPAVSAVTYSRDGGLGFYQEDKMPSCSLNNRCQTTGASSAAAAVASGIMALVLQANPNLGWRDIQHLIARSSCSKFEKVLWRTNHATYNKIRVSDQFGFGLLDAYALTENAKSWTNVGKQLQCRIDFTKSERLDGVDTLVKTVDMNSCVGGPQRITALEHVVIVVSLWYTYRQNIEIEMESPRGTKSIFLRSGRYLDDWMKINGLSILSLHYWGEDPQGNWTMRVRNVYPNKAQNGSLYRWSVIFYGTEIDPMTYNTITPSQIRLKETSSTTMAPTTIVKNVSNSSTAKTIHQTVTTSTESRKSTTEMPVTGSINNYTTMAPTTIVKNVSNSSTAKTIHQTVTTSTESRKSTTEMPMTGSINNYTRADQHDRGRNPCPKPGKGKDNWVMILAMMVGSFSIVVIIYWDLLRAKIVGICMVCRVKCVDNLTVVVAAVVIIVGTLVGLTVIVFVRIGTLIGMVVAVIIVVATLIWVVVLLMKIDVGKLFKAVVAAIKLVGTIVGVVVAVVGTLEVAVVAILIIEVSSLAVVVAKVLFIVMGIVPTVVVSVITLAGILAAVLVTAVGCLKKVALTVVVIVAVTLTVLAVAVIIILVIKWPPKKRTEDRAGEDVQSKDTVLTNIS